MEFGTSVCNLRKRNRSKPAVGVGLVFSIFFLLTFGIPSPASPMVGLKYTPPNEVIISPFLPHPYPGFSPNGDVPLFQNNLSNLKHSVEIDSLGGCITCREMLFGEDFRLPMFYRFEDYLSLKTRADIQEKWRQETLVGLKETGDTGGGGGIKIDIPFKIKSRAFQRVFGGSRVGLRVSGNININGGLRRDKRSEVITATNRQSNYNFKIDQTQQFTIEGKVGDKVSVFVDQDSERMFEFENNIRLKYTGEEDEIIQSIQAGNIGLSLPSTRFVSFSGHHSGLFGLKSEMKLGALNVTAIASLEKGEKKKLEVTGGAQETTDDIRDYEYRKGYYFFLDNDYRENYRYFNEAREHYSVGLDKVIQDIEVYKSNDNFDLEIGSVESWACWELPDSPDKYGDFIDTLTSSREHQRGYFIRLEPGKDYYVDNNLGLIQLEISLRERSNEILGVAYQTAEGTYGDLVVPQNRNMLLKLIRPRTPNPTDSTWNLAWRNVYYLGATNIEKDGFDLKIYYDLSGADDAETDTILTETGETEVQSYLTIFGLDTKNEQGIDEPDTEIDDYPSIINWARGELIFPDLTPFEPSGYYIEGELIITPLDSSQRATEMYHSINQTDINRDTKFYVRVKYQNRSDTYNLGWNVLEGSEEVLLNGTKLNRGTDYVIDYMSGSLTMLNEAATAPNADLEILYESGSVFQLDKKTLLGGRAEYRFLEDSFLGMTALYMNETPIEERVRVGNEPLRNFVWGLNGVMRFKPEFLTRAVDFLPLIRTEEPSAFNVEGEIAQVLPDPNPMHPYIKSDRDGAAIVDDFEGARKTTPLGVMRRQWSLCSSPGGNYTESKRWREFIWYNPFQQVPIKEIWPNRPVNTRVANNVHVLNLGFISEKLHQVKDQHSWAGVMRALSSGYADQTDSRYIEMWIKGEQGRIHVDIGKISEDVIPNGRLDTEDIPFPGRVTGNGLLDEGEDVGLDGMAGTDPGDFWDINGNGIQDPGEPPSMDDWDYQSRSFDYDHINGIEGNQNDVGGRFPDTEDLNRNGSVDLASDFFRYSFTLGDQSYIVGEGGPEGAPQEKKWHLYRIPLEEPQSVVGCPEVTMIEYARLWVSDFEKDGDISIATFDIVGNDWRVADSTSADYVEVAVINNHENPQYDPREIGVAGELDRITELASKEQSLVLKVKRLPPGEAGMVEKVFGFGGRKLNFTEYRILKMFVHGGGVGVHPGDFDLWDYDLDLFVRFGADENNYYEFKEKVWPGWHLNNEMVIDFADLNEIKLKMRSDPTQNFAVFPETVGEETFYDTLRIVGKPSLTEIKLFVLGLTNKGEDEINENEGDIVEVWFNELRLTDVKKDRGWAYRARADLKLADLANFNIEVNHKDDDFHNLSSRVGGGRNENRLTMNSGISLDRMLPPSLGLRIPVNLSYTESNAFPKYFPGSDIEVNQLEVPDSIRTKKLQRGITLSLSRTSQSPHWFSKYTIDKTSLSANYNNSRSSNPTVAFDRTEASGGSINYGLTFSRDHSLTPFGFLGEVPLVKKISQTKFYYSPTKLNLGLSASANTGCRQTRSRVTSFSKAFFMTQKFSTGYRPTDRLSFDFSRTTKRDLLTQGEQPVLSGEWENPTRLSQLLGRAGQPILEGRFGDATDISQNVTGSFNTPTPDWLSNDWNYSTNYHWSHNIQSNRQSASNQNTLSTSAAFKFNRLMQKFKRSQPPGQPPKRGGIPLPPKRGEDQEEEEPQGQGPPPGQEEGKKQKPPSLLDGLRFLSEKMGDIRYEWSQSRQLNNPAIQGTPGWNYQLGLVDPSNPDIEIDSAYVTVPSWSQVDNHGVRTALNLTKNISSNLQYKLKNSQNHGTTVTGELSHSSFYYFKKGKTSIQDFPFFEWSLRWGGLEKTPLFSKLTTSVSLDHSFTGNKAEKWKEIPGGDREITNVNYTKGFQPLVGLNIMWKKGISTNLRLNQSETVGDVRTRGEKSRTRRSSLQLSASYSLTKGVRIPLSFWPFKNRRFKNKTDFSLTGNWSQETSERNTDPKAPFYEVDSSESWSLMSKINYSFTNKVTGGVFYEFGKNKRKAWGESSYQELGLDVRIVIRGG
ncbi:cell surface protein SprA [candidate division KSB1 bacterium]|nr:cell surface protein SprA [candidate division KSB1 bacterium]